MKRILHIGLVIAIVFLTGCSVVSKVQTESTKQQAGVTTEALVSSTERVDLNQEGFADIYHLSADAKVDEIYVYSKILKKPRNLNDERVSFEEFKAVYGLLLSMDCKNSTQNEADFYDNPIEYTLDFAIDEGTRYRLFHIEFGKSYLLVNLKGVNTFAYKHELSEGDYESLKELLGKTPPALVH